jgi:predicted metal-dependent phosphoesterase TrpH
VESREDAFNRYIGRNGTAYVEKYKITAQEVIELIHSIGGAAFLAHPGINNMEKAIPELKEMGLDGIEVIHPKHSEEQVKNLQAVAEKMSLLTAGGSDFHGGDADEENLGQYYVTEESVNRIRDYCEEHKSEWIQEETEDDTDFEDND